MHLAWIDELNTEQGIEIMWKEAVQAYFKVTDWQLPTRKYKNHKKLKWK